VTSSAPSAVAAISTEFSYQGRLTDSSVTGVVTGSYDFQFTLWDSETGGCQNGVAVTKSAVSVTGGVFSTQLDFGNEFPGVDRWLEISVKKPADASYTTLSPRQKIGAVPYAIQAANVSTASGNTVVTAINDTATTGSISAEKISEGVAKIGVTEQSSTSIDLTAPLINIKSIFDDGNTLPSDVGRFRVGRDGSLLASGRHLSGAIPATGLGTRLMWFPGKSAFRAGFVASDEWDDANVGNYSFAGGGRNIAKGIATVAFGRLNKAMGSDNIAMGYSNIVDAPGGAAIGVYNICTGYLCLSLGYENFSIGAYSVALGNNNVAAGNNSFAIGSNASTCVTPLDFTGTYPTCGSTADGAFVWSDGGLTVQAQAGREFRARAFGGFRFRTSEAANAAVGVDSNIGCDLDTNSSTWTCASSRSIKENFNPVNGEDILGRLKKMPMTTWNFIGEQGTPRHLGPVAEDFFKAFELGKSEKSIGVQDLAGVSLAATKALEERTAKLQAENDALRLQVGDLAKRLEKLEGTKVRRRTAKK
jgi:hypothetical protein